MAKLEKNPHDHNLAFEWQYRRLKWDILTLRQSKNFGNTTCSKLGLKLHQDNKSHKSRLTQWKTPYIKYKLGSRYQMMKTHISFSKYGVNCKENLRKILIRH